jgi:coproporphyrinogen III oxidase-like Fe-S oxidoreductase
MAEVEAGKVPIGGEERLTPDQERLEELFLRLRTFQGVPATAEASDLVEAGLLAPSNRHLVPTERGMLVLNELVLALVT